jgi:hypothetical protein
MGLRDLVGKVKANTDVMGGSQAQKRLRATGKAECYQGVVKTETARLTKGNEKSSGGRMQIMLQISPVDGEGKPKFPTVPLFLAIPQPTPPEVFEALNEAAVDDSGNARGQDVQAWDEQTAYDYLAATEREEAAPLPKWNKTEKVWEDQLTDSVFRKKEDADYKERIVELMSPVHQFMLDSFLTLADKDGDKAEIFKGDEVYFTLSYGPTGTGFPSVKLVSKAALAENTVIEDINAATETN